jgi:tyrosine-protein kinase Etk/Wzc
MKTDTSPPDSHEGSGQTASSGVPDGYARGGDGIALLDLLIRVSRRKRIVLRVTVGFTLAAAILSFILPQRFTATVILLPPQQNSSISTMLASQFNGVGGLASLAGSSFAFRNPNEMYVTMLKSHTVEDAMIQKFDLMKEYRKSYLTDARKAFERRTVVDGTGRDGLIHISVEDRDPRRASDLANGYVDQFRLLSQHLAITEASQRRLFFEQDLVQARNNLSDAEEALKRTEVSTGVIQLDSQARALIETGAMLRAQISAREVQIQGMQTYAAGENAQLIQAQQELAGLRAQLAQLGGTEESDGIIVPKGLVPEAGLEYIRKLRDVKYYEAVVEILARQFELAKLDEARQGAPIQVVDPAVIPDKRSFPKRTLLVCIATVLGLFFGTMSALLLAAYEDAITNPETASKFHSLREALYSSK